jgi:hypothetical protein
VRCPPVQRCAVCNELLIHRGKRSPHESASYLGQIVHNLLPQKRFTFNDVDGNLFRRELRLLRMFEHKSPGQRAKYGQSELLKLFKLWAEILEHIKVCPAAVERFALHQQSGVYLIQGDPHEGNQLGESLITRLSDGMQKRFTSEENALCWIALLTGEDRMYVRDKLSRRRIQPEAA